MSEVKKILGVKDTPVTEFISPERQSIEQTEDYAIKKSIKSKEIVTGDHNINGDIAEVVNVCYGTDATPPDAATVPNGTIYIQYTP